MCAAAAKTLATVKARSGGTFSSALSRLSPAPMIRCYSISPSTRRKILYFGFCNYFEFSGGVRKLLWRPLGHLLPYSVEQGTVAVTERLGKLGQVLYPGKHWLVPFIEKVISIHPTDEFDLPVDCFWCTTKDKADICICGLFCCKVVEPILASYKVAAPIYVTLNLAKHKLIAALGQVTLSKFLNERDSFIQNLLTSINAVSIGWGIETTRFEIKDLSFPVKSANIDYEPFYRILQ